MGAEYALWFRVEVVGTVAQVVGKAQDGTLMGDKDIASGTINRDRLTAQVTQGRGIIHLTDGEGINSP